MLSEFFNVAIIHPLQEQVLLKGICSHCHRKSLEVKQIAVGLIWYQCFECSRLFALEQCRVIEHWTKKTTQLYDRLSITEVP